MSFLTSATRSKMLYLIQRKYHDEYLTTRPAARKGHGSIAHEAKPNGLLETFRMGFLETFRTKAPKNHPVFLMSAERVV